MTGRLPAIVAVALMGGACLAADVGEQGVSVRTVGPGGGGYLYSMGLSRAPNRLYVGCDVGGFYRSDDLGRHYRILNTGLPNVQMNGIAENPADPETILVATTGGACLSRNGGYSWTSLRPVAKGAPAPQWYERTWPMRAVAWSPANPRRAWMGAGSWRNDSGTKTPKVARVWRSDDGCASCEMVVATNSPILKEEQIFAFSPHPTKSDEILATTPGGLYLSTDGGVNWSRQTKGLPDDPRVWARWACHAPGSPDVVYASFVQMKGKYDPKRPHESGVWKSLDGGRSWAKCGAPPRRHDAGSNPCSFWNEACVFVDPRDENVVWASGLCFFEDSVWKSVDGGRTWAKSFTGAPQGWLDFWGRGTPRGMALSPSNPDVVAYGNSGSVYLTEDGGKTWHQRYTGSLDKMNCAGQGLEVTCLSGLVPDRAVRDRWYLLYMDLGLMITENGGRTMHRSAKGVPRGYEGTCFSLVPSPDDPKLLWSTWGRWCDPGVGGYFMVSRDAGETWAPMTNGWTRGKWPLLAHVKGRAGNDVLFASSGSQFLQESRDGGAHWTTNAFPRPNHLVTVAADRGCVYVGTRLDESRRGHTVNGALWRSSDEGRTWTNLTAGVKAPVGSVASVAFRGDAIAFAARHPHDATRGGVYVSRDRGGSWRKAIDLDQCMSVVFQGGRLVAGCARRDFGDGVFPCGGVFASDDLGETWRKLVAPGFDRPNVMHLAADPAHPDDLWVGTHGNSIFVLSPTEKCRRIKVACIGDSITAGYAIANPERDAYPAQLQRMLGEGYDVKNFGMSALGVYRHLPWKNENGKRAWEYSRAFPEALAFKPDIVIAGLGANDWHEHLNEFLPGENGEPILARGTFRTQYFELLKRFKDENPKLRIIVWTKLTPLGHGHECYGKVDPFMMRDDLKWVAEKLGAEELDVHMDLYPFRETGFNKDGIHPNPSAAKVLAELVMKAISPKKKRGESRSKEKLQ